MINKFKENVLKGYYRDHNQGSQLLDMDLEAIMNCEESKEEIIQLRNALSEIGNEKNNQTTEE